MQASALRLSLLIAAAGDIVDEPTSRLDLSPKAEVTALLAETARETGMALLFVSHDAELIREGADRMLDLGADRPEAGVLRFAS